MTDSAPDAPAQAPRLSRPAGWSRVSGAGILALLFMLPLLWMMVSSLRPTNDILAYLDPLSINSFIPNHVTLANYRALSGDAFNHAVVNSLIVTSLTVVGGLVISVPAAFALGVLQFRGRSIVFTVLVAGFIVPFDILSFPLANLVNRIGLTNSMIALIAPALANGFAVFLLRQFFMSVPRSLYEAARVDGASIPRILVSIYAPVSRGAIVGAGILFFVSQWQAYLWPLLVAPSAHSQLAPVRLAILSQSYYPPLGEILAGATILFALPALGVLFLQRYFVASIATSGITG